MTISADNYFMNLLQRLFLLSTILLSLIGCGQTGSLYIPCPQPNQETQ